MYTEIVEKFIEVTDIQKYCIICCLTVLESSQYLKARILAIDECRKAVNEIGPNSLGKRGIQSISKCLDDSSPECRSSAIKTMTLIRDKLNGDQVRLFKACGQSISSKGRSLLEKLWDDPNNKQKRSSPYSAKKVAKGRRESFLSPPGSIGKVRESSHKAISIKEGISLNLRLGEFKDETRLNQEDIKTTSLNPFQFHDPSFERETSKSGENRIKPFASVENKIEITSSPEVSKSDAATSLRARLKQIRERHQPTIPASDQRPTTADTSAYSSMKIPDSDTNSLSNSSLSYSSICNAIEICLNSPLPIPDESSDMNSCIESLRQLHTAIISPSSESNLKSLRKEFEANIDQGIDILTRYVYLFCLPQPTFILKCDFVFVAFLALVSKVEIKIQTLGYP